MNLKIISWSNRLGNNIIQILNCIQISLFYGCKYNIIIPNHKYFNTNYIILNSEIKESFECITEYNNFYYFCYMPQFDKRCFGQNIEKSLSILRSIFKSPDNKVQLHDNDLVIHIRSGDIFDECPHAEYIPSPLSFYSDIIESKNWSKIHILSENKLNPVIDELLNKYIKKKNISYKMQDLDEDLSIILQARHVVMDIGTFVPTLLLLSSKIKQMYNSCNFSNKLLVHIIDETNIKIYFYLQKFLSHVKIVDVDYQYYRLLQTPWKNSAIQRQRLIEYNKKD